MAAEEAEDTVDDEDNENDNDNEIMQIRERYVADLEAKRPDGIFGFLDDADELKQAEDPANVEVIQGNFFFSLIMFNFSNVIRTIISLFF